MRLIFMKGIYNLPFLRSFLGARLKPTDFKVLQASIGDDVFQNFSNAYFNLLAAITDNDHDFIQKVCHDDLFHRLKQEMKVVEQNDLKIRMCSPSDINAEGGQIIEKGV